MMDGVNMAVQARQLGVQRGRQQVLHQLELQVPEGAVLGLVGPNGAGKSTLLQAVVGLVAPSQGSVCMLGRDSTAITDAERARLGYVAQSPDLFDWLNAQQHCARFAPLYPHWDQELTLARALAWNLPLGTRAGRMSLGDQQKLSLLLALAPDPDLLVLDEPMSSLDPLARREVLATLFERSAPRHERPRTVLVSSHLLTDLERVASHVAFLDQGRIGLHGAWDELAESLRLQVLPEALAPAASAPGVLHRRAFGGEVRLVIDARLNPVAAAGGQALGLEDLYVELHRRAR